MNKLRAVHRYELKRIKAIKANEELFGANGEPVRRLGNVVNVRIVEEIGIRLAPYIPAYAHA